MPGGETGRNACPTEDRSETTSVPDALDRGLELFDGDGFGQVLVEAGLAAAVQVLVHAEAADGDALHVVSRLQQAHDVVAAAVGQGEVADDQVDLLARSDRQRVL